MNAAISASDRFKMAFTLSMMLGPTAAAQSPSCSAPELANGKRFGRSMKDEPMLPG
jgi:hypothetical protein